MSDKLENELASLLEMRYSDDPYNHQNLFRNFFESNKAELKNPSIWHEIRNLATIELTYKTKYGEDNLVNMFLKDIQLSYELWSRMSNNI